MRDVMISSAASGIGGAAWEGVRGCSLPESLRESEAAEREREGSYCWPKGQDGGVRGGRSHTTASAAVCVRGGFAGAADGSP